jgi:predicted nucleotidyltransferase component of viral defense system
MVNFDPRLPNAHNLLTPLQQSFLRVFAQLPDQSQFYLTGGTALAEYYLGHRLSYDLDFFTGVDGLVHPVSFQLEKLIKQHGIGVQVMRRFATYVEFLVVYGEETLKIDLALDSPFRFEPPVLCPPGIQINNFTDICTDKLLAYYGRAEPRDAVDLYCILQTESADHLFVKAKQKDPGFDAYWFAIALNRCLNFPDEAKRWPVNMLVEWDPKNIKNLFQAWAIRLMEELKS